MSKSMETWLAFVCDQPVLCFFFFGNLIGEARIEEIWGF